MIRALALCLVLLCLTSCATHVVRAESYLEDGDVGHGIHELILAWDEGQISKAEFTRRMGAIERSMSHRDFCMALAGALSVQMDALVDAVSGSPSLGKLTQLNAQTETVIEVVKAGCPEADPDR